MKNYDEMANNVFERRDQYELERKRKRRGLTRTLTPICCACFVALIGLSLWQGGMLQKTPPQTAEDSIIPGEKDWYGPGESEPLYNTQDGGQKIARNLVYKDKKYVQVTSAEYKEVEPDEKIGSGEDFEGTYTAAYLVEVIDYNPGSGKLTIKITSEVFTVKDRPDLLCVKLSNGDMDVLKTYD